MSEEILKFSFNMLWWTKTIGLACYPMNLMNSAIVLLTTPIP